MLLCSAACSSVITRATGRRAIRGKTTSPAWSWTVLLSERTLPDGAVSRSMSSAVSAGRDGSSSPGSSPERRYTMSNPPMRLSSPRVTIAW